MWTIIGAALFDGRASDGMLVSTEHASLKNSQLLLVNLAEENGEMVDLFGVVGEQWFQE